MRINRIALILGSAAILLFASFATGQVVKNYWAQYDSGKVAYYDFGGRRAKNAIIFVHCWTCNADFWKQSYPAFPNYRRIGIDLPGHGESDKPKTTYSMEYFARAIEAVMKDAKVEKAVLVGHSMGTPVIRQFYRLYPEQTLGLVVVDGPLKPFGPKAQMETFFASLFNDYKNEAPKFIDGLLGPTRADLKPSIRAAMLATPDYVGVGAMKGMLDDAIWLDDKINVPVLAIMAAKGPWPPDTQASYKTIAPNLEYIAMPDVSHFLFMEKPKEFNEAVANFVAKQKLL